MVTGRVVSPHRHDSRLNRDEELDQGSSVNWIERKARIWRLSRQVAEIVESEQSNLIARLATITDLDRGDRSIPQRPQPAREYVATGRETGGP